MQDVARLAGVSISSVSNYLADYPYMKPITKQHIQEAIDALGYVTNERARSLRSGRTGLISLSIPSLTQAYFAELAEEIIAAARRRGYGILIESTGFSRDWELASVAAMARRATDGLIMSPLAMEDSDIPRLRGEFPLVLLGERLFDVPAPHVLVHNVEVGRALTEHLIAAGCETIAFLGGVLESNHPSAEVLRTKGYVQALEAAGRPVRPELVRTLVGEATSRAGVELVERMVAEGVKPDGVVCYSDLVAFGVVRQLREMRVRIPDDVRVVSIDNLDEAQYTMPSLTSVELGRRQIAELAVDSILKQVKEGRAPAGELYADYEIMYRESSPAVGS
ncbi:LacI family DNA-binding transcriptional regulator [Bifidobacterium simiarum]|uniref:LacI family transcriptional regulator n=1 Tax=Bifidobacterium simiarum TaxID=2045441 RepID=A0A2M9HFV2_9BIFI|nr:LacI family DNA-binding transcriptional regulator [Bifidobacterium simiarum]PJM75698.1 LacI family transcriptional regulator [Bifidobacterium simiarum]